MAEVNYYNWQEALSLKVPENMRIGDDIMIVSDNNGTMMQEPRRVDVTTFIIIDSGNSRFAIEGKVYKLQAPSLAVVLPGQTYHLIEVSSSIAYRAIVMSGRFTDSLFGLYHESHKLSAMIKECPILDISRDLVSFDTYYDMLLRTVNSPVKSFRLESAKHLTLSLLYYYARRLETISREKDKGQLRYEQFREDVRKYFRINKSLPFYAGKLGVSVSYLTDLLKEKHGMTAAEYIDEHTLVECKALLNSTQMSMNQISRSMGFPSPSVFGKFFKRMTGVSPTEYRENTMVNSL